MIIKANLTKCPNGNAHVEIDKEGNITLYSYTTKVCTLSHDGWLEVKGLYGATTRKHIGYFMAEYITYPNGDCGSYSEAKHAYHGNYRFNVQTGEIEDLPCE